MVAALTAEAAAGVRTRDQERWLDLLDAEHDNVVAALADGVRAEPTMAMRMIGALIVPWWFRGRGRETRRWVEVCLATIDETTTVDPAVGAVLTWTGLLADFGDADEPGPLVDELYLARRRQVRAVIIADANGDDSAVGVRARPAGAQQHPARPRRSARRRRGGQRPARRRHRWPRRRR